MRRYERLYYWVCAALLHGTQKENIMWVIAFRKKLSSGPLVVAYVTTFLLGVYVARFLQRRPLPLYPAVIRAVILVALVSWFASLLAQDRPVSCWILSGRVVLLAKSIVATVMKESRLIMRTAVLEIVPNVTYVRCFRPFVYAQTYNLKRICIIFLTHCFFSLTS